MASMASDESRKQSADGGSSMELLNKLKVSAGIGSNFLPPLF